MTGTIISYNRHRKYGFIQNDRGDFFFHGRDAYRGISVGDEVKFDILDDHVKGVTKVESV